MVSVTVGLERSSLPVFASRYVKVTAMDAFCVRLVAGLITVIVTSALSAAEHTLVAVDVQVGFPVTKIPDVSPVPSAYAWTVTVDEGLIVHVNVHVSAASNLLLLLVSPVAGVVKVPLFPHAEKSVTT